jgi:PAS domain S-box-containing protein
MVEELVTRLGSEGQELLEALLQSTAEAVYAVDHSGRVLFANPAAVSTLGFESEDELIGRPSHATIHHSHPGGPPFPESECPLLRPRATGVSVRVEEDWFIRRDGTFVPVAYSSAPVSVAGHRGAVVVFHDISEERRAEADRRLAQALHASRARIVKAALEERRRLGRDLHDGAQQRLVSVLVALQAAMNSELGTDGDGRSSTRSRKLRGRSMTCATWALGCIPRCSPTAGYGRRSPHQERTGRRDRRHLKVLPAPGQPLLR